MEINVLLECNPDCVNIIRNNHGFKNEESVTKIVLSLESWMKEQKYFRNSCFSRHYLETTILASKGNVERAQKKLENLYRLRSQHPQFFGIFNIKHDFKEFHKTIRYAIPRKLTKDFNRILIIRSLGKNFQSNLILQFSTICIMIFEYLKINDYSDGMVVVVDLTQVNLMDIIKKINLQDLRQAASILIEGYGLRVRGLHVISKSKIVNAFIWIFKQVLNAKLLSRIHVHLSSSTLHDFIPRDILPVDYDGTENSFEAIHQEWVSTLSSEEFRNYLTQMGEAYTTVATTTN